MKLLKIFTLNLALVLMNAPSFATPDTKGNMSCSSAAAPTKYNTGTDYNSACKSYCLEENKLNNKSYTDGYCKVPSDPGNSMCWCKNP